MMQPIEISSDTSDTEEFFDDIISQEVCTATKVDMCKSKRPRRPLLPGQGVIRREKMTDRGYFAQRPGGSCPSSRDTYVRPMYRDYDDCDDDFREQEKFPKKKK